MFPVDNGYIFIGQYVLAFLFIGLYIWKQGGW
jgi:hypothetical protein